ncbi:MAG: hypothetical protein JSU95_03650 [Betaproteobacteria bacterium]|nr:MAG: hypothetical protein JSU95_03650 [Betaproteobacteria bacterium]
MRLHRTLPALFVALMWGCATGPEYKEIQSDIPAIEAGKGRVYLYRPQMSFLYVGSVTLNGEEVRVPSAGGFVYVDKEPDEYEVVIDAATNESARFEMEAGEEIFIRITVDAGGLFLYTISPQFTDRDTAIKEMQELNYPGSSVDQP